MAERRGRPDFLLLIVTFLLVGFGLIMVFSASWPLAIVKHATPVYFLERQAISAGLGLFLMFLFMGIPYVAWKKPAPFLMLFALLMLLLVIFIGPHINGAKRWFVLGGINLQPTEIAKLSIIVYLSAMISKKGEGIRLFKTGLLPTVIVTGLVLFLVILQPDFGTMLILLCISAAIIFAGGANLRHIGFLILGGLPVLIYLAFSKSYRSSRISSFLNPLNDQLHSGYQLIQSLYALGHGGWLGAGLGKSVQKLFYLPEAHTDFIFAVIGEEWGFIGVLLLLLIYFLFFLRGFLVVIRCSNPFGIMLGMGIVVMIFVQLVLNIGAVTGILPVTGVPLPLISYGGSSLILCLSSVGILLSISRDYQPRRKTRNLNHDGLRMG
jgi:cell division protein FtsW